MVAAMASLVMWLAGYRAERQCLHRHYQASSVRHKRVLSYLSLAEEVIRHEPDKVRRLNIGNEMKKLGKSTVIWSWWHDHITGDPSALWERVRVRVKITLSDLCPPAACPARRRPRVGNPAPSRSRRCIRKCSGSGHRYARLSARRTAR